MTTKAQKTHMKMALKVAIVQSGKSQREIARRTGIHEVRLSGLVTDRFEATQDERQALARVLQRPQRDLFVRRVQTTAAAPEAGTGETEVAS